MTKIIITLTLITYPKGIQVKVFDRAIKKGKSLIMKPSSHNLYYTSKKTNVANLSMVLPFANENRKTWSNTYSIPYP